MQARESSRARDPVAEGTGDHREGPQPGHASAAGEHLPTQTGSGSPELPSFDELAAFAEARLRDTLAQIEGLRQSAHAARARLAAEVQVQRRRAGTAEDRVQQLENALGQAQEASEEQRVTCAELTTILRAAEHRLSTLEKTLVLRDQELAALRQGYEEEIEQVRLRFTSTEEQLARTRQEFSTAKERFQRETGALLQERGDLAATVQELQRQLGRQAREGEHLAGERHRLRESASSVGPGGQRRVELSSQSEQPDDRASRAVLEATQARDAALGDEVRRQEVRLAELADQLGQRERRCRELEEDLKVRLGELRSRSDDIAALGSERDELRALVEERKNESEQLRREVADLEADRDESSQERDALEGRLAELETALSGKREQEALLQGAVSELQQRLQKEQSSATIAQSELQSQIRLRESLEGEVLEARAQATKLEAQRHADAQTHLMQLAKSTDRVRALEAERDALEEQTVSLVAQRERLERECEQLRRRAEMERQKAEMARLQAKLEEVELRHPSARRLRPEGDRETVQPAGANGPARTAVPSGEFPIIAVGASTGGPAALGVILPMFKADAAVCFVIVQHMPPGYTAELASCLDQQTKMTVLEARDGDILRPGLVLVAPGGQHMEVKSGVVQLSAGPPVNKHRPSVDVLFDSLIPVAPRVHAVLLSGMGSDGVAGMGRLRAAGAETIVQDEASSVVWGMPGAAVRAGCAAQQLPPLEIGRQLVGRARTAAAARTSAALTGAVEAQVAG